MTQSRTGRKVTRWTLFCLAYALLDTAGARAMGDFSIPRVTPTSSVPAEQRPPQERSPNEPIEETQSPATRVEELPRSIQEELRRYFKKTGIRSVEKSKRALQRVQRSPETSSAFGSLITDKTH